MKIKVFGESHAPEIGVEIRGVPAGTRIDMPALQAFLDRRAPGNGQGGLSTPRREPDRPEFVAGVRDCVADGSTIRAVIRNTNVRPQDYSNVSTVPRPGHADYASWLKCGKIPTGGGKWSGRMTAPLCIAGGIALQLLARRGVAVSSEVESPSLDGVDPGDSVGAAVRLAVTGFPAGVGDVGEDGIESRLAAAHISLSLDRKASDFLVEKGYDSALGARPLRRVVQMYVEDPLADLVLAGKTRPRMRARLAKDGQSLKF